MLEACRSATVGKTAVFRSVAPRLIQAGVGSVLSMGHAVHVEAARVLLDRFYRELVRGTTIGHAVAQGRTALVSANARWIEYGPRGRTITLEDWFLPHVERLRHTTEFETAFQPVLATSYLGRVLDACGASAQAIPTMRDSVRQWEVLV